MKKELRFSVKMLNQLNYRSEQDGTFGKLRVYRRILLKARLKRYRVQTCVAFISLG